MIEREGWTSRIVFGAAVIAVLGAFWVFMQQFWVPAHPGMDQNGYLVGGRMLAERFTLAQRPPDAFAFVGKMWVATADGAAFHPKYPAGLPVVVSVLTFVFGPSAAYFVSPVCMTFALLAVFLLVRQVAGSFAGILGTLIVASSPVTLGLANNPNSHAASLALVAWGMCLLLRWWERGTFWRAALAGALLGCAVTVRYGEALLVIPLLLVAGFNLHWRRGESWGQVATLVGSWLAPVGVLLLFNYTALGSWTGYDSTGESGGAFRWEYFAAHWDAVLRQLSQSGLFLTLPIGVMGLILLLARNARLALVLWAWLAPGVMLYTSYYYLDTSALGSARFYLTMFPPLALGAAWCMTRSVPVAPYAGGWLRWVTAPLAALVVVLGAGAYNVYSALPVLAADQRRGQAVARAAEAVREAKAPAGSVIFGPREMLHHLQFVTDHRLYCTEEFDPAYVRSLKAIDPTKPNALQPSRAAATYARLKDYGDKDFAKAARGLMDAAFEGARAVYIIVPRGQGSYDRTLSAAVSPTDGARLNARVVARWVEPAIIPNIEPLAWELVRLDPPAKP